MPRRADFLSILVIAAGAVVAAPAAADQTPTAVPPRYPTAEESRESLRVEAISRRWAAAVRDRRGLATATCSIVVRPSPGSVCNFGLDGIDLIVWNEGRSRSGHVVARLSFGNRLAPRGGGVIAGAWIRTGDLIEVEAGRTIYPFPCEPRDDREITGVQCILARDFPQFEGRARYLRPRYRFNTDASQRALGRALAGGGAVRIFHNGRAIPSAALTGAAQDFARQDFERLAAR